MRGNQQKSSRIISEFEERVIQIKRVSKKTKGGNKIGFTALVVLGDRNSKIGVGYGKALNVVGAISKAVATAKNDMTEVKVPEHTIAHQVTAKYGAAKVFLKPAPKGTGIIAGGAIRTVLNLCGIKDISAKMIGSNNKICNIKATIIALKKLKG